MAGPPATKISASAVFVPMTKIMQGEVMFEVVVAEIMMIAVLKAAPIKAVKVAAIKSAAEGRTEAAVHAAAAMGLGADLGKNNSK